MNNIKVKRHNELIKIAMASILKWVTCIVFVFTFVAEVSAQQESNQMVRLAKLVIDSTQLESYNAMLKEEIAATIKGSYGFSRNVCRTHWSLGHRSGSIESTLLTR